MINYCERSRDLSCVRTLFPTNNHLRRASLPASPAPSSCGLFQSPLQLSRPSRPAPRRHLPSDHDDMAAKLSPFHSPLPFRSHLIKNTPDLVPSIDELEALQSELKSYKQKCVERARKAEDGIRTIEDSMRRMSEREKGKFKSVDRIKRERDCTCFSPRLIPHLQTLTNCIILRFFIIVASIVRYLVLCLPCTRLLSVSCILLCLTISFSHVATRV